MPWISKFTIKLEVDQTYYAQNIAAIKDKYRIDEDDECPYGAEDRRGFPFFVTATAKDNSVCLTIEMYKPRSFIFDYKELLETLFIDCADGKILDADVDWRIYSIARDEPAIENIKFPSPKVLAKVLLEHRSKIEQTSDPQSVEQISLCLSRYTAKKMFKQEDFVDYNIEDPIVPKTMERLD